MSYLKVSKMVSMCCKTEARPNIKLNLYLIEDKQNGKHAL